MAEQWVIKTMYKKPAIFQKYRQTPDGQPTVADIAKQGLIVRTNYGTGGRIIGCYRYFSCTCGVMTPPPNCGINPYPDYWAKEHKFSCTPLIVYSIHYVPLGKPIRSSSTCYLNEFVAVGGRLLKLYVDNSDEAWVYESSEELPPMQLGLFKQGL